MFMAECSPQTTNKTNFQETTRSVVAQETTELRTKLRTFGWLHVRMVCCDAEIHTSLVVASPMKKCCSRSTGHNVSSFGYLNNATPVSVSWLLFGKGHAVLHLDHKHCIHDIYIYIYTCVLCFNYNDIYIHYHYIYNLLTHISCSKVWRQKTPRTVNAAHGSATFSSLEPRQYASQNECMQLH